MTAIRKTPHFLVTAAAVCCLMLPCGTLSQKASDSGKLPDANATAAAKSLPMTQMLDQLAAKHDFNFVMCEAPEPDLTADIAFEHPSLKDSLNAICKPFDYTWHPGPGGVMLFECGYTKFNAMPPLTPGEVWAVLEDFAQISAPYHEIKGDGLRDVQKQLVGSLTLEQWKTLRARAAERGGLGFDELTPAQQRLMVSYVTAQEFDFFVREMEDSPWLFPLQADEHSIHLTLHPPGSPILTALMKPTGEKYPFYMLNTRCTLNGREYEGFGLTSWNPKQTGTPASSYRAEHNKPIAVLPPAPIDHTPAPASGLVHLHAQNARLTEVVALMSQQAGIKVALDRALRDVRVTARLDNVPLETALQALAAPHEWRTFKPDAHQYALYRRKPAATDSPVAVAAAMLRCLPPAARRYMQMDISPSDLSATQLNDMRRNGRWNWKLERACEEARSRCHAWELKRFQDNPNLTWADLSRGQQNDVLSAQLYGILKDARPLHRGFPGYVAAPGMALIGFSSPDPAHLSLQISGRNMNGSFNSGISLNDNGALTPEKMTLLRANGVVSGN